MHKAGAVCSRMHSVCSFVRECGRVSVACICEWMLVLGYKRAGAIIKKSRSHGQSRRPFKQARDPAVHRMQIRTLRSACGGWIAAKLRTHHPNLDQKPNSSQSGGRGETHSRMYNRPTKHTHLQKTALHVLFAPLFPSRFASSKASVSVMYTLN